MRKLRHFDRRRNAHELAERLLEVGGSVLVDGVRGHSDNHSCEIKLVADERDLRDVTRSARREELLGGGGELVRCVSSRRCGRLPRRRLGCR